MSNNFFKNMVETLKDEDLSLADDGLNSGETTGFIDTGSYVFNALLSADIYGGMPDNKALAIAGETSTGKTFFQLGIAKHFQEQFPDGGYLVYDTEAAITKKMMAERGIDTSRVLIGEPGTVQQFRHKAITFLDAYIKTPEKERPRMLMALDSLGMLSTSKELEDSTEGKDTRDMTRSQIIRAAFRILRLKLAKAKVPLIVTNHTYAGIGGMYPTQEMCLSEDTLIKTPSGVRTLGSIAVGDAVNTLLGPCTVDAVNTYHANTFDLEMEDGTIITASGRHKFLVEGKWLTVAELYDLVERGQSINISAVRDFEGAEDVYREQVLANLPIYDEESSE